MDATSRILVFEAIKRWRHNKTTIVITHDLSQIEGRDFVYVLKDGRVVEQGYRSDLQEVVASPSSGDEGEFRKMMESQMQTGGYLPEKQFVMNVRSVQDLKEEFEQVQVGAGRPMSLIAPGLLMPRNSSLRPLTFGNWMFELKPNAMTEPSNGVLPTSQRQRPATTLFPADLKLPTSPDVAYAHDGRRYSMPSTPSSPTFTGASHRVSDNSFFIEKAGLERSADRARQARTARPDARTRWAGSRDEILSDIIVGQSSEDTAYTHGLDNDEPRPSFWDLMRSVYPTVPQKSLLFLGFALCIMSGAMTPIFSFLLSRLLFEVSIGAQNVSNINFFGGLVLAVAAIDGLFLGLKYFVMETSGMLWITKMRKIGLGRVLMQDKKWFDLPCHAPARLVQILVKDADDARELIAVVWAQFCIVVTMLFVGIVWALISGWQLTLAGVAIAPVFALTMAIQSRLVAKCEVRNKRAREEVARGYYDVSFLSSEDSFEFITYYFIS